MLKPKENGSKTSGIWFLTKLSLGAWVKEAGGNQSMPQKNWKFGTIPSTPQLRLNEIQLGIGILSSLPHCWSSAAKIALKGTFWGWG